MAKGKRGPDVPLYKKYALALTAGSLGGIAVLAVLLCLFAFALSAGGLTGSSAPMFSSAALAVGAFVSGFITAKLIREHGLLVGALSGAWMFIIVCVVGAFVGVTELSGAALFRLAISAAAAALGGIVGVNLRRRVAVR